MIGINCLQDLKSRLISAGFEIKDSQGWYILTVHGRWTMSFGEVYLDSIIVKNINDAPIPKKKLVEKKIKEAVADKKKPKIKKPVKKTKKTKKSKK